MLCAATHNTYLPTWEGWLYLATVIDCFTPRLHRLARSAEHMRADLIIDALAWPATATARWPTMAIFHSDHGAQYTSKAFATLRDAGLPQSMGAVGDSLLTGQYQCFPCSATRRDIGGCGMIVVTAGTSVPRDQRVGSAA